MQKVKGAMAYTDGGNNIVLAGKVGENNIVHEVAHAVYKRKIMIPRDDTKYKLLDIFHASQKTGRGFVSTYAKTDVDEFFAECYAAFAQDSVAFTKLNSPMAKLLKGLWK